MKIEIEELSDKVIAVNDGNHSVSIVETTDALDYHLAQNAIRIYTEMLNRQLAKYPEKYQELFIVRLYDGFDHEWMDITEPLSKEKAQRIWNKKTENGTKNTKYADIDYYAIYPADTEMLYSAERHNREALNRSKTNGN